MITVEEGSIGGFGEHVSRFLLNESLLGGGLKLKFSPMGLPDRCARPLGSRVWHSCGRVLQGQVRRGRAHLKPQGAPRADRINHSIPHLLWECSQPSL